MQQQMEIAAPATAAGPVKSAARALDLLDEIAANGPGTQLQLSTRLSIPKSSLHALLRTMVDRGWLQTDPTGSVYQLGIHSLVVSSAYLDGDPVLARAASVLDEVNATTGRDRAPRPPRRLRRHLHRQARVDPPAAHALRRRAPAAGVRHLAGPRAARRAAAGASAGGMVPESIAAITPNTTTDKDAVLEIIERAVVQGYATESEESCMGVRCFGVALPFGPQSVDALSVAVPISRLDNGREDLIIETLLSVRARVAAVNGNSLVR